MMFLMRDAQHGHEVLRTVWREAKARLMAGQPMCLELKERTRSNEASAKFHAMCMDYALSGVAWAGKRRTQDEWKVLLISGHAVATKLGADVVPGLEGEFCNIRESSARMTTSRMNSLIEYTYAMGTQMGVRFTAPEEIAA